jgi:T5SS/PEP-CTERM-associated repeat protein
MKNKSILQSILTGLFVVLALAASNSIVRAQCPSTTWNNNSKTGNWDDATNWNPCLPHDSDTSINIGVANITTIPNPLRLPHSLTIGDGTADSGGLIINVPQATNVPDLIVDGGDLIIGKYGRGTLSIVNGIQAFGPTLRSFNAYIGAQLGSTGTVNVSGSGLVWELKPSSTLFIGCTADSAKGGTATLNIQFPAVISIANNSATIPGIEVGLSGTLNGSGIFALTGLNDVALTAAVFGTLAPQGPGALIIDGNLDLKNANSIYPDTANTLFHVTPQAHDEIDVYPSGGLAGMVTLGGRITVIVTGTFTVGQSFTLLHAENGRGTTKFASTSIISLSGSGSCLVPMIEYTANDVNLVIVNTCLDEMP